MNGFTPETTVGEIAARCPASVRVFESRQIDFCCGGGVSVEEACRARGLNPGDVLDEVARTSAAGAPERDWTSASLSALVDHIVGAHHAYLQANLPRIAALMEKVGKAHGERHGDVLKPLAATFGALRSELESHLMKEEMILFPLIRRLEAGENSGFHCGSVQNPIRVMFMEHDSAGGALAGMRETTSNYRLPDDACNTYRALYFELEELEKDLHQHIHLENNILFPRAVELEAE